MSKAKRTGLSSQCASRLQSASLNLQLQLLGRDGDRAQLAVGLSTAYDELVRARRKREYFRSKLTDVRGAGSAPGDTASGQSAGDGNIPDHRGVGRLGVDV